MLLTTLRNKILSFRIANNKEGNKKYLYYFELFAVVVIYSLSLVLWKYFIDPGLIINYEFILLGVFNVALWILFYQSTIIAKLPRTQRYLQILFQFVRVSFISLVTLLLLRIFLGLYSINLFFILFYAGLNLFIIFHIRWICP